MEIKLKKGLSEKNIISIVEWNNKQDEEFLRQWAGNGFSFPLNYSEIEAIENVYGIFFENDFVGMIQKISEDEKSIHIGRFIINPEKVGLGIGTVAIEKLCKDIFNDSKIEYISLNVYLWNEVARKVYEKVGFEIFELKKDIIGNQIYNMRKGRY